jgi:hypothetical protein
VHYNNGILEKKFTNLIPDVKEILTNNIDVFSDFYNLSKDGQDGCIYSIRADYKQDAVDEIFLTVSLDGTVLKDYDNVTLQSADCFSKSEKELIERAFALSSNGVSLRSYLSGYFIFKEEGFVTLFLTQIDVNDDTEWNTAYYKENIIDNWYLIILSWIPG